MGYDGPQMLTSNAKGSSVRAYAGELAPPFCVSPVVLACYRHGYKMPTKVPESTKTLPDAKTFGRRLRWLRQFKDMTLRQFAERIGCDPGYLSKLETGRAKNASDRFTTSVVINFRVNAEWLRSGKGDPFWTGQGDQRTKEALPDWTSERVGRIMALLDELPEALAAEAVIGHLLHDQTLEELQTIWHAVRALPNLPVTARLFWNDVFMHCQEPKMDAELQKRSLQDISASVKQSDVKPHLPNLLVRLREATNERGKKSALAEYLGVPLASVSQWLSGVREPGGETTLRLLRWVEAAERK